ncbi:GNAT family N-acetyltransferase [candidate division KSB1 bacterium]|nr:GNAT family N-acetyltransferase [candidate division KSB1 bacterium]
MNYSIKFRSYFQGKNLDLIAFEKHHIEMVAKWINDEQINIPNGARFPVSEYEQMIWYEKICKDKTKRKLIISTKNREHVGMVSLFNIDYKNQNSEIGVYVIPKYQGKGYAKEALNLLLTFAFFELNLHKIYASIYDFNIPAIKLFESVGFQHESTNKEVIYSQGKFIDVYIYSIFRRDLNHQ